MYSVHCTRIHQTFYVYTITDDRITILYYVNLYVVGMFSWIVLILHCYGLWPFAVYDLPMDYIYV
jgi:hypothetical protein